MNKKNARNRLIVWSIIAVMLLGVFFNSMSSRNGFYNMFGFINMGRDDRDFDYNHKLDKINEWSVDANNISDINIDLTVDDVLIQTTDEKDIKIIEKSNYKLNKNEYLQVSDDNKVLDIYRDSKFLAKINNISFFNNKIRAVEIYIPKEYYSNLLVKNDVGDIKILSNLNLKNISINQHVGEVSIREDINCDKFTSKSDTGNIEGKNINAKEYNIKAAIGDIDFKGISGKGRVESNVGDINCEIDKIDGNIDIKSNVGDVDLYIKESLSFGLDAKSNVGDIDSNFQFTNYNKEKRELKANIGENTSNTIKIKSDVGDISIYKK